MGTKLAVTQVSEITGISRRHLQTLCLQGKIRGAEQIGGIWLIPEKWAIKKAETNEEMSSMITVPEAAKRAGVTRPAIYSAIEDGLIKGAKKCIFNRNAWRVCEDSLMEYIEKRKSKEKG